MTTEKSLKINWLQKKKHHFLRKKPINDSFENR